MALTTGGGGAVLVRHQRHADDRHSSGAADHLHGHRAGGAQGPGCAGAAAAQGSQKQPPPTDRTIVVQVLYRPGAAPTYKINETEVAKGIFCRS
jgi:hypothetical protein